MTTNIEAPQVPQSIVEAIQAYGDARADFERGAKIDTATPLGKAITAIRAALASAPAQPLAMTDEPVSAQYLREQVAKKMDGVRAALSAQTAPKVPDGFDWPKPPARKGQSHVLFDDGYAEGWAKAISVVQAMLAAAPQPPAPSEQRKPLTEQAMPKPDLRGIDAATAGEWLSFTNVQRGTLLVEVSMLPTIIARAIEAHGIRSTGGEQ